MSSKERTSSFISDVVLIIPIIAMLFNMIQWKIILTKCIQWLNQILHSYEIYRLINRYIKIMLQEMKFSLPIKIQCEAISYQFHSDSLRITHHANVNKYNFTIHGHHKILIITLKR